MISKWKKGLIVKNDIQDALLKSIQIMIDNSMRGLNQGQGQKTNDIGKIISIDSSTRTATVQVGSNTSNITTCYLPYNISFSVNDVILMAIYNGNYSLKYGIAILKPHS